MYSCRCCQCFHRWLINFYRLYSCWSIDHRFYSFPLLFIIVLHTPAITFNVFIGPLPKLTQPSLKLRTRAATKMVLYVSIFNWQFSQRFKGSLSKFFAFSFCLTFLGVPGWRREIDIQSRLASRRIREQARHSLFVQMVPATAPRAPRLHPAPLCLSSLYSRWRDTSNPYFRCSFNSIRP